ncbi:TetR/AcrR family transcriptional regulator [Streptacidiphilus sp. PAMC 29251]
MVQQEHTVPHGSERAIPEQRNGRLGGAEGSGSGGGGVGSGSGSGTAAGSGGRLRVDARRNLESVLRAAREVFGELGYGAPMEEVARRAGVGVGTVYRRFPSKEVLVRRIAAEEVSWLTAQALEALESLNGEAQPWDALAGYLTRAVATGAGRLLPPEAFRYAERMERIPVQRAAGGAPSLEVAAVAGGEGGADADPARLLELLAQLVERARSTGELRTGVTVSDVVLVLTASVPAYTSPSAPGPTATGTGTADGIEVGLGSSTRLLRILLDGLRAS